jgi:hypothetical protein
MKLSDKEIAEYLHRCYTAADGLWFVKVEEKYGFESALNIDKEVWKIIPKIQSRFLKNKLKKDHGLDALLECFSIKLKLDGFKFKTEKINSHKIKITINSCPWHNIMINSNRSKLSEKVGSSICNTEYSVWAKEFGDDINFKLEDQICKGSRFCILTFQASR